MTREYLRICAVYLNKNIRAHVKFLRIQRVISRRGARDPTKVVTSDPPTPMDVISHEIWEEQLNFQVKTLRETSSEFKYRL